MAANSVVRARIDARVKDEATAVLEAIGDAGAQSTVSAPGFVSTEEVDTALRARSPAPTRVRCCGYLRRARGTRSASVDGAATPIRARRRAITDVVALTVREEAPTPAPR